MWGATKTRNDAELQKRRNRTVYFGTESISSLAPKIWELIPSDIRSPNSLEIFKEKVKFWTTDKCPCTLCKTYIGNVDYSLLLLYYLVIYLFIWLFT